jgi:hypothetical protein
MPNPYHLSRQEADSAERIGMFLADTFREIVKAPNMAATKDFCSRYRQLQKVLDLLPDSAGASARNAIELEMADLVRSFVAKQP